MLYGKKTIGTIAYMGGVMTLPEAFCWSYGQMIQYNSDYLCAGNEQIYYSRATISYHSAARNFIANTMKGDWLLMLDTDHQFEPDIAARLVRKMYKYDLDVLSGIYQYKSPPHSPVLYNWEDGGLTMMGDWDKPEGEYFIPVGSAGAGCLLIRKRVLEKIKETNQGPFDIIHPYSEDHSFFKRIKDLGIEAFCDPSVEANHLMVKPLSIKDYDTKNITLRRINNGGTNP